MALRGCAIQLDYTLDIPGSVKLCGCNNLAIACRADELNLGIPGFSLSAAQAYNFASLRENKDRESRLLSQARILAIKCSDTLV